MFFCPICKHNFTRKEHLERHLRSHNDEKPFLCSNCGKAFGRKDLLTRHNKSDSCLKSNRLVSLSNKDYSQPKKVLRCQLACQACVSSKCRCVRSNNESNSCEKCLKRNILCISRNAKHSNSRTETKELLSVAVDDDCESKYFESVAGDGNLLKISNLRKNLSKTTATNTTPNPETSSVNLIFSSNENPKMNIRSKNINEIQETSPSSHNTIISPSDTFIENNNVSSEDRNIFMNNPISRITSNFSISPVADKSFVELSVPQKNLTGTSNIPYEKNNDICLEESNNTKNNSFQNCSNFLEHTFIPTTSTNLTIGNQVYDAKSQEMLTDIKDQRNEVNKKVNKKGHRQREQQAVTNSSDITEAFSYYMADPVLYNSSCPDLTNRFDFNGVLNPEEDVIQETEERKDTFSDLLDNWIYEQNVNNSEGISSGNCFSNNKLELAYNVPQYFSSDGDDRTCHAERLGGSFLKNPSGIQNNGRKDNRQCPRYCSFSDDIRPSTDFSDNMLDDTIHQKSDLFTRFEVLPETRDSILIILSKIHQPQFCAEDTFFHLPSANKLTLLIINYFKYFHTRYEIIHMPSFKPNAIQVVLLITILGAGSFFCGAENKTMKRTGTYLLEISRKKLTLELERTNSKLFHIELYQASLINCICGSWSGIDRNVEIAASFTSTMITMIRSGELFKRYNYKTLQSIVESPENLSTESRWQAWVNMESQKRYSELEVPLPHLKSLWKASTASEWFKVVNIIKNTNSQHYSQDMSFQLLLGSVLSSIYSPRGNISTEYIPDIIIGSLISIVKLFISEINDRLCIPGITDKKQRKQHHLRPLDGVFHISYLANRKSEVESMLESLENFMSDYSFNDKVVFKLEIEYSFICLHSCVKDCMKFAGVEGEHIPRETPPRLIHWFKGVSGRITIWHCAQVLRFANSTINNKIFIPYLPLLIFHSSLILWTYSSLLNTTCNFDLKEIITTSLETNIGTSVVLLNDDWSQETDRFVELNDNIPCLRTKKYNGTVTSKGITKELIFLCVPEDIIDYSIQINSEISCGLLSNHINDLLKSLRSCNNGIILS